MRLALLVLLVMGPALTQSPEELVQQGKLQEAEQAYRELQAQRSLSPEEFDSATQLSAGLNHWERVIELLESRRRELTAGQKVRLYEAYLRMGQREPALAALREAVSERPDDQGLIHLLAFFHLSEGDYASAERVYDNYLAGHPEAIESLVNRALVQFKLQKGAEAMAGLKKAFSVDFDQANVFFYRQLVRNMAPEGLAELAEDTKKELNLKPDGARAHLYLAREFENLKRFANAIQSYEQYLELEPEDNEARFELAGLYSRSGRDAESREMLESLINLGGTMGDAARLMAAELAVRVSDFERAQQLAANLPATFHSEPAFLYTRARIEIDQGNHSEAEELLQQAIHRDPDMAEAYFHLAQLHLRSGRAEEGRRLMEKFRQLQRSPE